MPLPPPVEGSINPFEAEKDRERRLNTKPYQTYEEKAKEDKGKRLFFKKL